MKPIAVLDLVQEYIRLFYPDEDDDIILGQMIDTVQRLLAKGYTDQDLMEGFAELALKVNCETPSLSQLLAFFKKRKNKGGNLLKPGEFYYHNQLRILPNPPRISVDYNSGQIFREVSEYFLEMRASYTVEDFLCYYYHKTHSEPKKINHNRFIGSIEWLLKYFTIDELLFMVDALAYKIDNSRYPVPQRLTAVADFESEGRKLYEACMAASKACEGDKLVNRKRVYLDRRCSGGSVFQQEAYAGYS